MFVHSMGSTGDSTEEPSGAVATGAASNNVALVGDRESYNSNNANSSHSKTCLNPLGIAMKSAMQSFHLVYLRVFGDRG